MQVLCGLQVVFFLFNCQTPAYRLRTGILLPAGSSPRRIENVILLVTSGQNYTIISSLTHSKRKKRYNR